MAANIWFPGYTATITGTFARQNLTATASQTIFDFTTISYTPGTGNLILWINGQLQQLAIDYTETSTARVTLIEPVLAGDIITGLVLSA